MFLVKLECGVLYAASLLTLQEFNMPVTSKYRDENVEQILTDIVNVLEKHKTSTDLSLMVLGNITTNIINNDLPLAQRKLIAEKFAQALLSSVDII